LAPVLYRHQGVSSKMPWWRLLKNTIFSPF
jgi:hypothetical protein